MKKNIHQIKYEPIIEEVDLIEAGTQYPRVRFPDDRETIVLTKQLIPTVNSPSANFRNQCG